MGYASGCQRNWGHFSCFAKIFSEMAIFENTQFLSISLTLIIKVEGIEIGYHLGILAVFPNFSQNRSHSTNEIHRHWVALYPMPMNFTKIYPISKISTLSVV